MLLSFDEVMEILNISRTEVIHLTRQKLLEPVYLDDVVRISRESLEAYKKQRELPTFNNLEN